LGTRLESSRERRRGDMFAITVEWYILYALIVVMVLLALRSFMNGVRILGAELREIRNLVRELDGPEMLRELKAIKYIIEGLESNYDGFALKERVDSRKGDSPTPCKENRSRDA
jgi:hypothetical protein